MTAAVLERPETRCERPPGGSRVTLEELLSATLDEARRQGSTECPVCQARMTVAGAHAHAAAGCAGCGSRLN